MATSATDRITYERIEAMPVDPRASEYMVRMRDGVKLATDVYLPEPDCGPGPTILIRLPYDKNGDYTYIPDISAYFAAHGYRVAAQDVRGKFRSEGETILWVNEAYDGYDTLDWIVNQPWSDGVVGMWGDSYYGFTQLAAASTAHPALRAIAPRVTGTRLGDLPETQRIGRLRRRDDGRAHLPGHPLPVELHLRVEDGPSVVARLPTSSRSGSRRSASAHRPTTC